MKSILTFFFIGISAYAFSQGDFDKRLLVKFDAEQLKDMAVNHPDILDYWTFYLDHSYEIVDLEPGKNLSEYGEIKFSSSENFNILSINAPMQQMGKTLFRIKNKDKLLILDSSEAFIEKYNTYRSNK